MKQQKRLKRLNLRAGYFRLCSVTWFNPKVELSRFIDGTQILFGARMIYLK